MHEFILRTSSPKRMGCIKTNALVIEIRTAREKVDELLRVLGRHWSPDIKGVGGHRELREEGVARAKQSTRLHVIFTPPLPILEVGVRINGRTFSIPINVVCVT